MTRYVPRVGDMVPSEQQTLGTYYLAADVDAVLASMTTERDKWKRWAIHRVPTHGTCCTCQRCGLDHDSCRCDLDEVWDELDKLKQQFATVTKELRERKDGFLEMALLWRGVELASVCQECGGSGFKAYANTTIWRGGAGGQAITHGVCNQCWGSGDRHHTWVNLKHEASKLATVTKERDRLKTMSTVEMMCENLNVKHHVEEWEARCLRAEQQLAEAQTEIANRAFSEEEYRKQLAAMAQQYKDAADERSRIIESDTLYKFVARERDTLAQQLATMTAERDEAVRIAIGLITWAPISGADVQWANERLAAHKHQEGLP